MKKIISGFILLLAGIAAFAIDIIINGLASVSPEHTVLFAFYASISIIGIMLMIHSLLHKNGTAWLKFLTYFWMYFITLICVINSVSYFFMPHIYRSALGIDAQAMAAIQGFIPTYRLFSVVYLGLAIASVFVLIALLNAKDYAPKFYIGHAIATLLIQYISKEIHTFTMDRLVGPDNSIVILDLAIFLLIGALIVVPQKIYFDKRKNLFKTCD